MFIDLVIIHSSAAHGVYGSDLANSLIAVEPPLWPRLIAGYVRDAGYTVKIIDAEALSYSPETVADIVEKFNPKLICIAAFGHQPSASTQQMIGASATAKAIKRTRCKTPIIMVGGHVAALPERTLSEEMVDFVCTGEGPATVLGLLEAKNTDWPENVPGLMWSDLLGCIHKTKPAPLIEDMWKLHGNTWDLLPMNKYRAHNWQCFSNLNKRQPYASIYTSLGCPYKCLSGDTVVNTLYGNFPIKELADKYGDKGIPVYTYDPKTKKTFISDAIKIRKYGEQEQLVRVYFDDGTHIDCTPDHKFLQFKWGNGKSPSNQWECEAKDLKKGAHVRAIRVEKLQDGRSVIAWGRRDRKYESRLIMEYKLGRELKIGEAVHHKDLDKTNDYPDNLVYVASAKEHFALHPEISERMRLNNPTKNMTPEWRVKITKSQTGLIRSLVARENYRESKLGEKNPNYKHGKRSGAKSRIEVNHRVTSVRWLRQKADVYCLTVPATGWFFANNVLVKNCHFCCINSPFKSNRYRMRDPRDVIDEIWMLYTRYGVRTFKIIDEMFILNERHYCEIANGLIDAGLGDELNIWAYSRVDTVKPNTLAMLRKAGFQWLALGIESGSKYVRDGSNKRLKFDDMKDVVRSIQDSDINVIGNYIFGLPDDNHTTMQETLDLAMDLNCEFANFYSAMAYPGSPLYEDALKNGWILPQTWRGYSQHNDDCRPLDTLHISGAEVLKFRDMAFVKYFTNPVYLDMVAKKFGQESLEHIKGMTTFKLKRKLLEAA
jgi:radical SAM superfamily enzyme YgiQ (UPF0313 family)